MDLTVTPSVRACVFIKCVNKVAVLHLKFLNTRSFCFVFNIIIKSYGPSNTHSVTTYGNGFKLKKYYDKYNRLIKVTDVTNNETQICAYIYSDSDVADEVVDPTDSSLTISANSKLYVEIDNVASTRTNYIYDEFGELKEKKKGDIREFFGSRDRFNRPISEYFINGSVSVRKGITYENKNSDVIKHESVQSPTGYTYINYTRDGLERLAKVKVVQGDCGYSKEFSYIAIGTEAAPEGTTNFVGKVSYYNYANGSDTWEKEEAIGYDADGNIVEYGDNTYAYDNLGRIVRENNKALDKTFVFEYNIGGNIVKKTEYAYTIEALDTVVAAATYEYTYANAWKDQLTSFGGKTITYDGAGNPTTYQGNRLFWSRGRLLTGWSAADGCSAISITYDANGIRTSKTKTDDYVTTETNFVYDNEGRLRTEIEGEFTRHYIYSRQGIEGYEENGERFIYRKNIFGDITAIYKGVTKVAEYAYDAWGNCKTILNTSGYGSRNPFRYRGYYWDEDLKMYYLMTRYYNPATGRFINADTPDYLDPETLGGLNLYTYCNNNPVMRVDPTGCAWSGIKNWLAKAWNNLESTVQRIVDTVKEKAYSFYYNATKWHFEDREKKNGIHPQYSEVNSEGSGWYLLPPEQSIYHDNGSGNPELKYITDDGREAVFDGDTLKPMTNPEYIATYNYCPLYQLPSDANVWDYFLVGVSAIGHFFTDMLPYYMTGNSNTREQFESKFN